MRKLLIVGVVALLAAALAVDSGVFSGASVAMPSGTASASGLQDILLGQWHDIPVVLILLAALAAIFALWKANRSDVGRLALATLIIVFTISVYELYSHNMLGIGWRSYFGEAAAGILLLLAWTYLEGWQRFVSILLLGASFAMLGFAHYLTWEQFRDRILHLGGSSSVVLNGGVCTERVQLATLVGDGEELNPKGGCFARVHEETAGECLDMYDRFDRYVGNDCRGKANFDGKSGARFAPSTRSSAHVVSVTYVLCNRRGNTDLVADGCP